MPLGLSLGLGISKPPPPPASDWPTVADIPPGMVVLDSDGVVKQCEKCALLNGTTQFCSNVGIFGPGINFVIEFLINDSTATAWEMLCSNRLTTAQGGTYFTRQNQTNTLTIDSFGMTYPIATAALSSGWKKIKLVIDNNKNYTTYVNDSVLSYGTFVISNTLSPDSTCFARTSGGYAGVVHSFSAKSNLGHLRWRFDNLTQLSDLTGNGNHGIASGVLTGSSVSKYLVPVSLLT